MGDSDIYGLMWRLDRWRMELRNGYNGDPVADAEINGQYKMAGAVLEALGEILDVEPFPRQAAISKALSEFADGVTRIRSGGDA